MARIGMIAALALVGCAPSAPRGPVASSSAAIVRGEDDWPEMFPGVVRVWTGAATCTGTLVATDGERGWVLTAAHCAIMPGQTFPAGVPAGAMTVFAGADVGAATPLAVTAVHVHPAYDLDRIDDPESLDAWPSDIAHDFALLEVQGVDAATAATVIPWLTPADDALAPGTAGHVAGYGRDDPDSPALPGTRQRAPVSVLEIVPMRRSGTDKVVLDERGGLGGLCWGDSGGPLLVTDGLGATRVGGVSSTLTTQRGSCADLSYLGRVSAVVDDFVTPTLAGAAPAPTSCYACLYQATVPGGECYDELTVSPDAAGAFAGCLQWQGFDACRAEQADGAAAYDALWACVEGVACPGVCGPAHRTVQECRLAYDGAGPCDACVRSACCDAASACQLDAACSPCLSRLDADDAACRADPLYRAARGCYDASCGADCGPYTALLPALSEPDGGTPDASVPDAGGDPGDAGEVPAGDAGPRDAGAPADAGPGHAPASEGCGCRVARRGGVPTRGVALIVLLPTLALARTARAEGRNGRRRQVGPLSKRENPVLPSAS